MQDERYRLVFRGEVLPDQHPAVVRKRLQELLKIDAARAADLFSGKAVVLRRDADTKTAARFQGAFKKAGARLRVLPVETNESVASAASGPAEASETDPSAPRKGSLAERLAAQAGPVAAPPDAEQPDAAAAGDSETGPTPAAESSATPAAPASADATDDDSAFALREAGADVLDASERTEVAAPDIDTTHLSAELPDAQPETAAVEESAAGVPDVSHLTLADAGALLVEPAAPEPAPPQAVDVDFEVLEVGSPLGNPDDDRGTGSLDFTDVDFEIAELGAVLGRNPMAAAPPPAPPDTSHITLDELDPLDA